MTKIKFVTPTIYIDTHIWFVFEDPNTLEICLSKIPINLTLIGNVVEKFKAELEAKYGPVELVDLGDWDNTVQPDGSYHHPFNQQILYK